MTFQLMKFIASNDLNKVQRIILKEPEAKNFVQSFADRNELYLTPLAQAIKFAHLEMVEFLMEKIESNIEKCAKQQNGEWLSVLDFALHQLSSYSIYPEFSKDELNRWFSILDLIFTKTLNEGRKDKTSELHMRLACEALLQTNKNLLIHVLAIIKVRFPKWDFPSYFITHISRIRFVKTNIDVYEKFINELFLQNGKETQRNSDYLYLLHFIKTSSAISESTIKQPTPSLLSQRLFWKPEEQEDESSRHSMATVAMQLSRITHLNTSFFSPFIPNNATGSLKTPISSSNFNPKKEADKRQDQAFSSWCTIS